MKHLIALTIALALAAMPLTTSAKDDDKEVDRIHNSGMVLREIMDIPDDIPQGLIDKAECIMVFPSVLKAAFIVGASYGRGIMICRTGEHFSGPWSAPTMMALEAGSFGFQIGGEATDFVLLVMNARGAHAILHSKVKLGGDASIAAGPVGRTATADSDVTLRAEVLSYSRARGLFAGLSLSGASVRPDNDANKAVYGENLTAQDIVFKGEVPVPPPAQDLVAYMNHKSPKNHSDSAALRD
jgi:SH3 domain-containing YSC84-like protein 1